MNETDGSERAAVEELLRLGEGFIRWRRQLGLGLGLRPTVCQICGQIYGPTGENA